MKEDTCVLCKTVMDRVIVCETENIRPFEEFQIWGDNAGPEYDWDDKSRIFLPKAYNKKFVRPLQICLKNRKVFIMEQVRYTNLELQQHIVSGDPQLGQSGHPRCEFCKTRFYDAAQLHDHLVKDHYSCHICEKQGILHKYYRDYTDLERHFRSEHFLCEEEECLQKKFVVFDSEIDLAAHTLQMHPHKPIKRQIQVNFKVKRSNWDGTGDEEKDAEEKKQDEEVHEWTYEGEIGDQTQPPEVLAARREAARRAARDGGMIGLPAPAPAPAAAADNFPTLSGGGGGGGGGGGRGGGGSRSGWAGLASSTRPRAEDFPALGGRGGRGGGGGSTFRSAVEAYPTRAQEIAMSGAGEGGWCFDYPMPPSEPTGGGGGGGRGRVAGIGNMKLKVDKKAEAVVVEDFPLAPGMRAPPPSAQAGPIAAANSSGPTLAQSIAARQQPQPQQEQLGGGGGPPSVVMELKELLGEEVFAEVKEISASYRSGWMMPGEYFKAMEERLPEERFGELFEGLIGTLPDQDKRREMQVLLAASRSVKAKAAAKKKPKKKPPPPAATAPAAAPPPPPTTTNGGTAAGAESWPEVGENSSSAGAAGGKAKTRGKQAKSNGAASNGRGKAGGGGGGGGGKSKTSPSTVAGAKTPGSAATWLKAMGTKTGGGAKTGGTGISIVRPSARAGGGGGGGGSTAPNASSTITAVAGGYSGSRLQCNPGVRARPESPPPGAPLRRRDEEELVGGIGQAGASWATQGGSGFKGASKATAAPAAEKTKISRDDFPGLPGGGGGAAALRANRADFPSLPEEGAGMRGLGGTATATAFKVKPRAKAPPPAPQQRPPTGDDFPGLPMPASSSVMPGMEKVDWGGSAHSGGSQRGVGGGGGAGGGGGKGTKKKNKQKMEKDALKGMAFGFR
ncbi:C2H2 zinc finger protein [Ectocarpus siliculosus]|uniref:C2H2 zinc finger protein n=1 Tax=Ectocarpus siliculosus TaxID=2880 RepID=D7FHL2_ECTSI|nr:C2H2 zinc finger protein [Ectocarpus siliculosus]|eukprot:CBJ28569.1 C2H2 zinc finger protein [Ectocarpus siliculosus]